MYVIGPTTNVVGTNLIVGVDVDGFDKSRIRHVRDQVEDLLEVISDLMVHWKLAINNLKINLYCRDPNTGQPKSTLFSVRQSRTGFEL